MDLIQKDTIFFADLLQKGGTVMICGALAMQQDAEKFLDSICIEKTESVLPIIKQMAKYVPIVISYDKEVKKHIVCYNFNL